MSQLSELVDKNLALLPIEGLANPREAEIRSAKLLMAVAQLAEIKRTLLNQKMKALSSHTVTMHSTMASINAKTITEKKATAEASPACLASREMLEGIENEISYIKATMDVFHNGHVLLRQMSRGEL